MGDPAVRIAVAVASGCPRYLRFATGAVGGRAERVERSLRPVCSGSRFGEALIDP
jgi:hypothetical protein